MNFILDFDPSNIFKNSNNSIYSVNYPIKTYIFVKIKLGILEEIQHYNFIRHKLDAILFLYFF